MADWTKIDPCPGSCWSGATQLVWRAKDSNLGRHPPTDSQSARHDAVTSGDTPSANKIAAQVRCVPFPLPAPPTIRYPFCDDTQPIMPQVVGAGS